MADILTTYKLAGWVPVLPDDKLEVYNSNEPIIIGTWDDGLECSYKFVNYDGTVLQSGTLKDGETPVYTGETPRRDSDGTHIYTFDGWTPSVGPVYKDSVFTAHYSEYEVVWSNTNYTPNFFYNGGDGYPDGITGTFSSECAGVTYQGTLTIGWDRRDPQISNVTAGEGYDPGLVNRFSNLVKLPLFWDSDNDKSTSLLEYSTLLLCNTREDYYTLSAAPSVCAWMEEALNNGNDGLEKYHAGWYGYFFQKFHDGAEGNTDGGLILGHPKTNYGWVRLGQIKEDWTTVTGDYLINAPESNHFKLAYTRTSDRKRLLVYAHGFANYYTRARDFGEFLIDKELYDIVNNELNQWYDPLTVFNNVVTTAGNRQDGFSEILIGGSTNYTHWYQSNFGLALTFNRDSHSGTVNSVDINCLGDSNTWGADSYVGLEDAQYVYDGLIKSGLSEGSNGDVNEANFYAVQRAIQDWTYHPALIAYLKCYGKADGEFVSWHNLDAAEEFDDEILSMSDEDIMSHISNEDTITGAHRFNYKFYFTGSPDAPKPSGHVVISDKITNLPRYVVEIEPSRGDYTRGDVLTYTSLPNYCLRLGDGSQGFYDYNGNLDDIENHILLGHYENSSSRRSHYNWDGIELFEHDDNGQHYVDGNCWGTLWNGDRGGEFVQALYEYFGNLGSFSALVAGGSLSWEGELKPDLAAAFEKYYNMRTNTVKSELFDAFDDTIALGDCINWYLTSYQTTIQSDFNSTLEDVGGEMKATVLLGYMEDGESVQINGHNYVFSNYDDRDVTADFTMQVPGYGNVYMGVVGVTAGRGDDTITVTGLGLKGFYPEDCNVTFSVVGDGELEVDGQNPVTVKLGARIEYMRFEKGIEVSNASIFGWYEYTNVYASSTGGVYNGWRKLNGSDYTIIPDRIDGDITLIATFFQNPYNNNESR